MSYYASNYYRNPGPYYASSDYDAPVPGWGLLPNIAGAARVGIGQIEPGHAAAATAPSHIRTPPEVLKKIQDATTGETSRQAPDKGAPWMLWLGVGAVVGVGAALAQSQGWLRGVGLK